MSNRPIPPKVVDLVDALLEAGCDIWSVGNGYSIGEPVQGEKAEAVRRILKAFGERDHLIREISDYLTSIGRVIRLDDDPK